jgi:hypothetical protein
MRIISRFSARELNFVGEYERFSHTRFYLRQKSKAFKDNQSNPDGKIYSTFYAPRIRFTKCRIVHGTYGRGRRRKIFKKYSLIFAKILNFFLFEGQEGKKINMAVKQRPAVTKDFISKETFLNGMY